MNLSFNNSNNNCHPRQLTIHPKDSRLFYSLQLNFNVRTESQDSQGTKIRRSLTLYLYHIFCSRPLLSGHKLQYCTQRADTSGPRFHAAFAKWSLNVQTATLSASAQIKTGNLIAETYNSGHQSR